MTKTCFITGGNSGIGKEAAIQIAKKGFYVIIGCRNEERGKTALQCIKAASNSELVELVIIDLASKKSIRTAAAYLNEKFGVLDVLIHNAADFDISRKSVKLSPDGIEIIWATNHLGPVLLTSLMLDALKKSKQGRIITIASQGLIMYPRLKVDLQDPEFKERRFSVAKAYYQSKLAQIMFTYYLSERLKTSNVSVNCIRVSNVKIDINRYPNISPFMKSVYAIKRRLSLSASVMAETYTWLATEPDLGNVTGKYFNEKQQEVHSSAYSKNRNNMKDLMDLTDAYLK